MLNIFVNTWGNYNENGADGGEWLTLPMDESELDESLKRIAEQMGDHDPEWAIHDYEWLTEWEGFEISEHENIHELNEYIQKLDNLDEWEQKTYLAIIEIWGHDPDTLDYLDNYTLHEDITNEYELGYYWAVESGCYDLKAMGTLSWYIDYERFGKDIAMETDGGFTEYGYIERS